MVKSEKLNDFIVEPFNTWYKQGTIKNFNHYINLDDKIEVVPANNFAVQQLNFGDTLDSDYISQQYSKAANREFGKAYYIDTENYELCTRVKLVENKLKSILIKPHEKK
mgnify:CR=1 FL=1